MLHEKEHILFTWVTENRNILRVLLPDHRRWEESRKKKEEKHTQASAPLVCECLPRLVIETERKQSPCSLGGSTKPGAEDRVS